MAGQGQPGPGPEMLSREDRVYKFGVDCVGPLDSDGICFGGGEWVPGGEYIKKLRVKNVSSRSVKLKYKLPVTRQACVERDVIADAPV
jgi:cilia- and flagella-associated protein 65